MVKVTPFILSLVIILFSGCGKSMEDVSGVYETKEIIPRTDGRYYTSTQWTLDLSESGKFTLKQDRSRVVVTENGEIRTPEQGINASGKWSINQDLVTLNWDQSVDSEVVPMIAKLNLENSGDLVCTYAGDEEKDVSQFGDRLWFPIMEVENVRFRPEE